MGSEMCIRDSGQGPPTAPADVTAPTVAAVLTSPTGAVSEADKAASAPPQHPDHRAQKRHQRRLRRAIFARTTAAASSLTDYSGINNTNSASFTSTLQSSKHTGKIDRKFYHQK